MKYALVLLLAACPAAASAQQRSHVAPADAPSRVRLTAANEPGDALRISGTVVDAAGVAVPNASIFAYQTDARGHYTTADARDSDGARIHGWLRADRAGAFEVTTIRPGSYPGTRNPQHVHFVVNAPGFRERVFEIVFADDPLVDDRIRGMAATPGGVFSLCTPRREGAVQVCAERVVLRRE